MSRKEVQVSGLYHLHSSVFVEKPLTAITPPPITPDMSVISATPCQTLNIVSGPTGEAADILPDGNLPDICAALNAASSGENVLIFNTTPLSTFLENLTGSDRNKRLTASNMPNAIGIKGAYKSPKQCAFSFLHPELVIPPSEFAMGLMNRGTQLEPHIRSFWNKKWESERLFASTCGFLFDQKCPDRYGATPDGLVWQGTKLVGFLEIKAPQKRVTAREWDEVPQMYKVQMVGQAATLPEYARQVFYVEWKNDYDYVFLTHCIEKTEIKWLHSQLHEFWEKILRRETFPDRCKRIDFPFFW